MNKRFGNFIPQVLFAALLLISSAAMAQRAEDQHVSVGGNVFGGGKKANVGGSSTVLIDQNGAIVGTKSEGALVENTGDVYGGGEEAKVNTVDGTTLTDGKSTNVTLRVGTVRGNLYGGGLGVRPTSDEDPGTPADVLGPVQVTINGGTVEGHVFGCNNLYGAPKSTVNVDVIKDPNNVVMNLQKNVYGGGNLADYEAPAATTQYPKLHNYPEVNIKHGTVGGSVFGGGLGLTAVVTGNPQVTIGDDVENHTAIVNNNVYGGGDEAEVTGYTLVTVQNANSQVVLDVYGGGNQAYVSGSDTVNILNGKVRRDVYGGGALANVGTNGDDNTVVNVLGGTVSGDVYGGGLGQKAVEDDPETDEDESQPAIAAVVNSVVTVNIGALNGALDENGFATSVIGSATIGGSVFGCNNANGTPKDNVTVNIFQTAHTTKNEANYHHNDSTFAIYQVFGGGNKAHYEPLTDDKKTTVHVWTCANTIEYLYGGGNAADVGNSTTSSADAVIIDGGRIGWVFGGGNGYSETNNHTNPNLPNYNPGANIFGDASVTYHAGDLIYLFGGSNQFGNISGSKTVDILSDGQCVYDNRIAELYGGNNEAPATGDVTLTMDCPDAGSYPCTINYLFGGSRKANITGNVVLTVNGGLYDYVFGGNNIDGTINGDVTLNLFGGTINEAAFGGNNLGGAINGKVTVNMLDQGPCPLIVHNIYGGGNLAAYTPTTAGAYPEVNLIHGTVSQKEITSGGTTTYTDGNVYGGGLGNTATVTSNPVVAVGYNASTMADLVNSLLLPSTSFVESTVSVEGNVYGGGDEAAVSGTTFVTMQEAASTSDFTASSTVGNDVYGGGNLADVSGSTTVNVTGGTVTQDVYGGGAFANVGTDENDNTTVTLAGGTVRDIYGGGLGDDDHEAEVNGAVQVTVNDGTVRDVFGCNNVNGAPTSTVQVVINNDVTGNVFGGGNLAQYTGNPTVNINNGTIGGNVYGGGKGVLASGEDRGQKGKVTGNPVVTIGYNATGYLTTVSHDVYGGGDAANVDGTPVVKVVNCNTTIGYLYGGGNAADVEGTNVTINGGTITQAFGGGHGDKTVTTPPLKYADVNGDASLTVYGGTIAQTFAGSNSKGTITGDAMVTINKSLATDTCAMMLGEVYGGGNEADGKAGTLNIGCTGTWTTTGTNNHTNHNNSSNRIGYELEGIGTVYGGANRADIGTDQAGSNIVLNINNGIIDNVFGGNNNSGSIYGTIQVNIDSTGACHPNWYVGDVFGGGNLAEYSGTPDVNIKNGTVSGSVFGGGNEAGVGGGDVSMTGGAVLGSLYGGCNTSGVVDGAINVEVKGGTMGSSERLDAGTLSNVFGGGFGESTSTKGNVTVTITRASGDDAPAAPTIYGDVYGGSAFGSVNDDGSDETKVYILDGILETKEGTENGFPSYTGGNVYGGGLGEAGDENVAKGQVNGKVFVNIGSGVMDTQDPRFTSETSGNATIKGNIYGCNNTNGSPQQDVVVNVYKTHHTQGEDDIESLGYALHNVFGGGNKANFMVEGKTPTVNIYGCDNTIERTFGGSNAAASNTVTTMIQGGHIHEAYGGGNGEVTAADIHGDVNLNIHGGRVDQSFGGSNRQGNISGHSFVTIDGAGCGGETEVEEFFCGGNFADYEGDIDATIQCADGLYIHNLYGGCKQADVLPSGEQIGNVHLKVYGGTYDNIFGGSQGRRPGTNGTGDQGESADINGSILLEIYGGKVNNAIYGGSHILGKVKGTITVNIENGNSGCELDLSVTDVYGGGNEADYDTAPTTGTNEYPYTHPNYPVINIKNATVRNVFGGGYKAKVMGNPQIHLKKGAKVLGNVYGGGNMGEVTDSPTTTMVEGKPKVNIDGKDTTPNPHVIGQPHDE